MQNATSRIENCIRDVRAWLRDYLLIGNDEKTDMILISSRYRERPEFEGLNVGEAFICPSQHIRNLGVMFDQSFTWEKEVATKVKESYFHIKNLGKIRKFITPKACETMVHAFVSSKLDYSNALLYGLPACLINKLQCVQNSAARIVLQRRKSEHITPVLKELKWLPVKQRIKFKVLLLTYKCLNGVGPKYLCDLLKTAKSTRSLRSSGKGLLIVPRTKQITYGNRGFYHSAPSLWNSLPLEIRNSSSLNVFKSNLKTYLFKQYFKC